MEIARRDFLLSAGATALTSGLLSDTAYAISFGEAIGAIGSAIFPPALAGLAGFALVRTINTLGDVDDLINEGKTLVEQSQHLISHIDGVIAQISTTLASVDTFIQKCSNTLDDVDALIRHLPQDLTAALTASFNESILQQNLGALSGHCAAMQGYLNSHGSILRNADRIQTLTDRITVDIARSYASGGNDFQMIMQMAPSLSIWMQGYTAYNVTLDAQMRSQNPWDHPTVARIAVPRINGLISSIKSYESGEGKALSSVPLDSGIVYTFDGQSFASTNQPFAPVYDAGTIGSGSYYCIWPEGVASVPILPPGAVPIPAGAPGTSMVGKPDAGDFCFLNVAFLNQRNWSIAPSRNTILAAWPGATAAMAAKSAYEKLLRSSLQSITAFDRLTRGWENFNDGVQTYLVAGDRDGWTKMPRLI